MKKNMIKETISQRDLQLAYLGVINIRRWYHKKYSFDKLISVFVSDFAKANWWYEVLKVLPGYDNFVNKIVITSLPELFSSTKLFVQNKAWADPGFLKGASILGIQEKQGGVQGGVQFWAQYNKSLHSGPKRGFAPPGSVHVKGYFIKINPLFISLAVFVRWSIKIDWWANNEKHQHFNWEYVYINQCNVMGWNLYL